MKNKTIKLMMILFAPVISGVLFVLAFPSHNYSGLAWFALVPLLISIHGRNPLKGFLLAFGFGFISVASIFSWIFEVRGYTIYHHILVASYLSSLFGLYGLGYAFITRRLGSAFGVLSAPFLWVSMEFVRSNLSFLALPWAWIAHTQHQQLHLIQFVSLTGTYSLSFLLVLANATIVAIILTVLKKQLNFSYSDKLQIRKTAIIMAMTTAAILCGAIFYGKASSEKPFGTKSIKVSVIQGNISQKIKWDPNYADLIMQRYSDLTIQASREEPDIIVWPEGATPGFVLKRMDLMQRMVALSRQIDTPLLIGSSEYPKFETGQLSIESYGNTALYFSKKGKVIGQYLKIILVPFTETIPFKNIIPWPKFILPDKNVTFEIPGKEATLFEINGAKFCAPICWETHFPGLIRKFAKKGANFMLNIVNEGRYGDTAAPFQLLSMTIFRAVENRVAIARSTNTGISCFIDPHGRVSATVEKGGRVLFVEGFLTHEIPISDKKSFYTGYGFIFVYLNLGITILILILCFIKPNNKF